MSLHFLIDGYNVIKQVDSLNDIRALRDARMSLVRLIQAKQLTGSKNNQVTIVFDGRQDFNLYQAEGKGQIKIIFSCNESADETIKRTVGDSGNPKQIVVVTDDKAIVYFSRSLGARAMPVSEFLGKQQKRLSSRAQPRQRNQRNRELAKIELTYQQQVAINQELSRLWGSIRPAKGGAH